MDRVRLGTVTVTNRERELVNQVLDSGFFAPGPLTKKFEEELAAAHGKKYGLALNSGQSAIMVALEAYKELRGIKRVACPAITYISSLHAIVQAGLQPILFDVEPNCEAAMDLSSNDIPVDAYLPCHLFGKANKPIKTDRPVVEDACESIYAAGVGYGDVVILSFYPSHTITAGYGGMILTNDKDLYFKCWQLVNHGRKDWDDYTTCHNLRERFTFSDVGYSLKFSDLNAAMGLAQHENREYILGRRRENARYLIYMFDGYEDLMLPSFNDHTFMMFPIIVRSDRRNDLEKALNDNNIETRRMMPLTNQPVVREKLFFPSIEERFPGAKFINHHGLYVGCHQGMTEEHLNRIFSTIHKFYKG